MLYVGENSIPTKSELAFELILREEKIKISYRHCCAAAVETVRAKDRIALARSMVSIATARASAVEDLYPIFVAF
ncbi:hypothetical protein A2U01_0013388 [Trifolium medium]|uniref:Uncharacterized protein n=1 Tax=Trifolium medium TaxID=97028 RepID=A0A392MZV9_9FABA|nr:hypothetical protein [Trifolium medium]